MTKVIIHNYLPKRQRTKDHWFVEKRYPGRCNLLQGAGTDGGFWMAQVPGDNKRFKSRREAEEHIEQSLIGMGYDSSGEDSLRSIVAWSHGGGGGFGGGGEEE